MFTPAADTAAVFTSLARWREVLETGTHAFCSRPTRQVPGYPTLAKVPFVKCFETGSECIKSKDHDNVRKSEENLCSFSYI